MTVHQEDLRSWAPPGAAEPSDAVALLTDLSVHRPARAAVPARAAAPAGHPSTVADPGRRRRPWPPVLVGAAVVAGLLALLTLAALPVLWDARASDSDEVLQAALLEAAEAQQLHLVDHGRYAADNGTLATYLARLDGAPEGVTLQVHTGDELRFCVAASATGQRTTLWVSESGEVTTAPCL